MHVVEPQIHVIADTQIDHYAIDRFLEDIGAPDWTPVSEDPGQKTAGGEVLAEIGGRLCYRSFGVGLNANVTKVREGTHDYIGNILKQKHGSVLEHASTSVVFLNVSRILTHEYVRHRAGMAFSQESMRFVRLDDIPMYIPDLIPAFTELAQYQWPNAGPITVEKRRDWATGMQEKYSMAMHHVTRVAEEAIGEFTRYLDAEGVPFHVKKEITSALRRMAPGGHTTNILGSGNHRAWRHLIANRTAEGAEVEIRWVFAKLAEVFMKMYPAFYQDMIIIPTHVRDGKHLHPPVIQFQNEKV